LGLLGLELRSIKDVRAGNLFRNFSKYHFGGAATKMPGGFEASGERENEEVRGGYSM